MKMKNSLLLLIGFLMLMLPFQASAMQGLKKAGQAQPSLRLIVKLKPTLAHSVESSLPRASLEITTETLKAPAFMGKHRIHRMRPLYRQLVQEKIQTGQNETAIVNNVRAKFARRAARHRGGVAASALSQFYVLQFDSAAELNVAEQSLKADPDVVSVNPDQLYHVQMVPNDPYYTGPTSYGTWGQSYDDLYGLKLSSSTRAWDLSTGTGVVVAIVDTGIDYTHPDVAANVWNNPADKDNSHGYNFVANTNNPLDDNGHGTHVAGTIAAVGNNNMGVIGLAWQAKVMAVKGLDAGGSGYSSALASAIQWATDNGADIINMSWGETASFDPTIDTALAYAYNQGVVLVAAAGNSSSDASGFYPAASPYVITVAATDALDHPAYFSNFGSKIDVAAPGVDILSLQAAGTQLGPQVAPGYIRLDGTSMATPHVSAEAALILSEHPTYSNEQVRLLIRGSADDRGAAGFDFQTGYGRINAYRALATVGAPLSVSISSPLTGIHITTPTPLIGTAAGADFASYQVQIGSGVAPTSWTVLAQSASPITQGTLAVLQPNSFPAGLWTVKLTATTTGGSFYATQITIVNDMAMISNPPLPPYPNEAMWLRTGTVLPINGTADASTFQSYTLDWATGTQTQGGWSTSGITLTGGGLSRVTSGSLGTWNTTGLTQSGYYTLRLRIQTPTYVSQATSVVLIEPDLASGWPQITTGNRAATHVFPVKSASNVTQLAVASPQNLLRYALSGSPLSATSLSGDIVRPAAGKLPSIPGDVVVLPDQENQLRITHADGTYTTATTGISTRIFFATTVELADLDADGIPEILVVAHDTSNTSFLYLYAFHADGSLVSTKFPLLINNFSPYGSDGPQFTVFDGDGIGRPQIWLIDKQGAMQSTVRKYDANGTLLGSPLVFISQVITAIASGNFYHDGHQELVIVADNYFAGQSTLGIYATDGTPKPGWPVTFNDYLGRIAMGDLLGDGQVELVSILSTSNQLIAYRTNGQVLTGWPVTAGGIGANQLAIADLDGDGKGEVLFSGQAARVNPFIPSSGSPSTFTITTSLLDHRQQATALNVHTTVNQTYYENLLSAIHGNGTPYKTWTLPGFPNYPPMDAVSFVIGDFYGDGKTNIALSYPTAFDNGGNFLNWENGVLAIFRMPGDFSTGKASWPYAYSDAQNSGVLHPTQSVAAPPAPVLTLGTTQVASLDLSWSPVAPQGGLQGYRLDISTDAAFQSYMPGYRSFDVGTAVSYSVTNVPFGPRYYLRLRAIDLLANVSANSNTVISASDTTPPTVQIMAPTAGAILSNLVTVSGTATDNLGVQSVTIFADAQQIGVAVGTGSWSFAFDTTKVNSGTHTLTAVAADYVNNHSSASIVVTINNPGLAVYDPLLQAPRCASADALCDSGALLTSRSTIIGNMETNQPNTLYNSCADGNAGTYHNDESLDRLKIFTPDNQPLASGKTVTIEATVWAYSSFQSDTLDLYATTNVSSPSWTYLTSAHPTAAGVQVLVSSYVLPTGALQAIRGVFRFGGNPAPCTTSIYDDHDDLVFAVSTSTTVPVAPNPPSNLFFSSATPNYLILSWNASTGPVQATDYHVDASTDPSFSSFVGVYNNFDAGNAPAGLIIGGLQPATTYYARARAYDALGHASINSVTAAGTTETTAPARINVALKSNGATAAASSEFGSNYPANAAITGNKTGAGWGTPAGGWNDATNGEWPDSLYVIFVGAKLIDEIDVYTLQDNYQAPEIPTSSMTFTQYGITDYEVQYYDGGKWVTVPGGFITNSRSIWKQLTFSPVVTDRIRVVVFSSLQGYSRIVDIEAFGVPATPPDAPVVTSPDYITVPLGQPVAYQITATNNPTGFNASGLPFGLSVSTTTGLISGTLSVAGSWTVSVSAYNAGGSGFKNVLFLGVFSAPRTNVALNSNGATATASSEYSPSFPASSVITGNKSGAGWAAGTGGWNDNSNGVWPDWVQVNFAGPKLIDEIDVYTLQDNYGTPVIPTASTTFTAYGVTDYQVQYDNNGAWADVTAEPITGNNLVWRTFTFAPLLTSKIRVLVNASLQGYSRLVNIEAYQSTVNSSVPVITSSSTATASVGHPFTYTITATNAPTSFNATGLPAGISVSTTTGLISGIPVVAGTSTISLSAANSSGSGQSSLLLIVTSTITRVNVALASNGATAAASSVVSASFPASSAITGNKAGTGWATGVGGWNDGTVGIWPDWLQITFAGTKSINEIDVYTVQDNYNAPTLPTASQTFSYYGITDFQMQYNNGGLWTDVPGGHITNNNLVWRQVTFAPLTTDKIRILVNAALQSYSRIVDVEAYEFNATGQSSQSVIPNATTLPVVARNPTISVQVRPNPFRGNRDSAMFFEGMTANATVKLFTISGHWIRTLQGNDSGAARWDMKNDSGQNVASGLYLYLITDSSGGKTRGKLAVIR